MSCGVGLRHGLDLALLWLWHRPAATALIGPLAWEPPYATGAALKRFKKKNYVFKFINFWFLYNQIYQFFYGIWVSDYKCRNTGGFIQ